MARVRVLGMNSPVGLRSLPELSAAVNQCLLARHAAWG
jgi:hypothetical protein